MATRAPLSALGGLSLSKDFSGNLVLLHFVFCVCVISDMKKAHEQFVWLTNGDILKFLKYGKIFFGVVTTTTGAHDTTGHPRSVFDCSFNCDFEMQQIIVYNSL